MARSELLTHGSVVLDCEGLAKLISRDKRILSILARAVPKERRVICSAATLIEAQHGKVREAEFSYARSRIVIEPVTEKIANEAVSLLRSAGLHGHRHAIDAMVAATAMAQPGGVALLTSDVDDMNALCGQRIRIVKV